MPGLKFSAKKQTENLLIDVANVFIKAKPRLSRKFEAIDWHYFTQLVAHHDVKIPAYLALKDSLNLLPKTYADLFTHNYIASLNRNTWLLHSFLELCAIFHKKDILFTPLKGIANTIDLYEQKPLRNMLDIDILVKKENFEKTERTLLESGYCPNLVNCSESYWKERHFQISYVKGSLVIDLHTGLGFNINSGRFMNIVKQERLWQRLRWANIDSIKIPLLSPEDSIIAIALHQQRFGNILRLKELCDFALLMKKYGESLDWTYLKDSADKNGLNVCLYYLLRWHKIIFPSLNIERYETYCKVSFLRKSIANLFLDRNTAGIPDNEKLFYLRVFFVTSDRLIKAMEYILFVPYEQFCKFFALPLYTPASRRLYALRLVYMPFNLISAFLRLHPKNINVYPGENRK